MDLYEQHTQNRIKLQNCFEQLQQMAMVPKSKMFKFYKNVTHAFNELDKEHVECRRNKKVTIKYTELESKFHECITVFEQWAIMATLTY